jgi:uncharacterized membrane-anchored protein
MQHTAKHEADRFINSLLDHAREEHEYGKMIKGLTADLKELDIILDDPGYIKDKEAALYVCKMLIQISLEKGAMEKGSIGHKLALRLYDYIDREKGGE